MADPVATIIASGESGLAITPVVFAAQPAGVQLFLEVTSDNVKTGDPAGWTPVEPEAVSAHAFNVWRRMSTGVETGVSYQINSATRSSYVVIAVTEINQVTPIDVVDTAIEAFAADPVTSPVVATSVGRKIGLVLFGGSQAGNVIPGVTAMTNGYTILGQSAGTVVPCMIAGLGTLVFDGGGNTNSVATFNPAFASPNARTAMTLVLNNADAVIDISATFELGLELDLAVDTEQTIGALLDYPLSFNALLIEEENVDVEVTFDLPLEFTAEVEEVIPGDIFAEFDIGLDFTAEVDTEVTINALLDFPLSFTADLEVVEAVDIEVTFDLGLAFTASLSVIPPLTDPCPWDVPEPECCTEWETATDEQRQRAVRLATEFLWAETGRQFGVCERVVLPCGLSCACTGGAQSGCHACGSSSYDFGYAGARFGYAPALLADGGVTNVSCTECRCCSPCEIALPGVVQEVLRVVIAGVEVPQSAYLVYDHKFLTRVDGQCWPECQSYGDPASAFEVTYTEGIPPPYTGLQAAADLACSLLRVCTDGVDCGSCINEEALGSEIVATFIKQANPYGLAQNARLLIPGATGYEDNHRSVTWRST